MIGGASVINVALGIVRTKVLAVLIGASGMGLFGAFSSITTLVSGVAGMGINISGVRQIAEAVGSNDQQRIARTTRVLRRTSFVLGLFGMLTLLFLCWPVSRLTFGNTAYAGSIALLSLTILFSEVAAGQMALVQGFRRIRDLAASSIWGALLGTIFSIPIIFVFREKGIVPFLIIVSALSIATSWWFARKIKVERLALTSALIWSEVKALLGMGFVFMASGLMTSAVAYLTRVMIIREMNLEASGLYQAAWSLSSVYVGFILGAMGADYFPRLTAAATDNSEVNRLVNEQTGAALLMALPGILGTLTFAPFVIHLLYSAQFEPATAILRWQILGVLGRVIAWPIGFVLLAKGRAKIFFWTELASNSVHLLLIWFGMKWFGLRGLGMAFFGLYIFCGILILIVVRKMTGFRWSKTNVRLGVGVAAITTMVFIATAGWLSPIWGMAIGGLLTIVSGFYALREIASRAGYANLRDAWVGLRSRITNRSPKCVDALP